MSFKQAFFGLLSSEVSQADLEAYRNAARFLDDLDAAIQTRIHERPLPEGTGPWARPQHHHHAMLFATVARELSIIGTVLLESDSQENPNTAGYLPKVTYNQVKGLYEQVAGYTQRAWEALANPNYAAQGSLPVALGPRVEARGKCPLVHLQGIHAAARSLHALGDAKLQQFLGTVRSSGVAPDETIKRALGNLTQVWARAQARFGYASNQLSVVSQGGKVSLEVHEDAENRLWYSLSDYFILAQIIAMPDLVVLGGANVTGRDVSKENRWFLANATAAAKLQGDTWGEEEMEIFWTEKSWRTTAREERYLSQCAKLTEEGALKIVGEWATCPFSPLYQACRDVRVLNRQISKGTEFNLDMDDNADQLVLGTPTFGRVSGYQEEHDGGH